MLLIPLFFVGGIARAENDHGDQNMGEHGNRDAAHMVGSTLEIHINDNGKVLVRGAKITAINGAMITAGNAWGSSTMTWNVDTTTAKMLRRYDGSSSVSEMKVGDYISFNGTLDTTVSNFTVRATTIKDWSVQVKNSSFDGTIKSIDATAMSFVLTSNNRGDITVTTDANTKIMRGDTTIAVSGLMVGDKVTKTEGLFNNLDRTLKADSVKISSGVLGKRTFEGTLVSIAGTTLPTSFVLKVGDANYTVNVPANISVLGSNWLVMPIANMQVNDTIRVYGAVQAASMTTIDASVVRDASR